MVRFGAEMVFSSKDSTITDEDIDRIIAKGEEATAELDAKMKKFTEDAIKFKMDDSKQIMIIITCYLFSIWYSFVKMVSSCFQSTAAELYDFDNEKVCLFDIELLYLCAVWNFFFLVL